MLRGGRPASRLRAAGLRAWFGCLLALFFAFVRQASAQGYQQGVAWTVYGIPAGTTGLPAALPPPALPLAGGVLPSPACPQLAACFVGGSGRAYTQNVAALVTGELWTPVDGMYSLFLTSTADSRLDLNGQRTIDVNDCATAYLDGSCAGEERSITFWMPGPRWHAIRIEYWNGESTAGSLTLQWSGPDIPRQRVPPANLRTLVPSGAVPSPPPPLAGPPPAGGCPVVGSISLALATAADPAAPHATCFARFAVQVDSSCRLEVVPAPGATRWQYSSVWSAVPVPQHRNMRGCPTFPLSGGTLDTERERTAGGVAAAIQAALSAAMFAAPSGLEAFSTISGVELGADSLVVTTKWPPNRLVFAVVSGSLGSMIAAGPSACAGATCVWNPATGCPPGRQRMLAGSSFVCALCPPGSSCAGGSAAPVACSAGRSTTSGAAVCSPCPAGSSSATAGMSHCVPCVSDWYQPLAGQTECRPCPPGSYAHFPGSAVCVACYFGKAVVMADGNGVYTSVTAEQPSHGFMNVVTSPASPLANSSSCGFSPWASACESLGNRTLALETDPSCSVSIAVLGDSGCSQPQQMTLLQGVYADASTILAHLPDDPSTTVSLRMSQTASGWSLTLFQLTTAFITAPGSLGSCTDVLTAPTGSCPPGTEVDSNPQAGDGVALYKATQCVPCTAGYKCTGGQASSCEDTLLNTVLGAAECDVCPSVNITDPSCGGNCYSDGDAVLPTAINFCSACPAGYWAAMPGRDDCQPCLPGTYRRYGMVSTQCWSCPPGSFSAAGASACTLCEPGTATAAPETAPDPATGRCPACPPGEYASSYGAQFCNDCPSNTFSDTWRTKACQQCAAGEVTVGGGATACTLCPVGTYAGPLDTRCASCPPGFETRLNGPGAPSCTPCRPGFFNPVPGQAFCQPCPPGQFTNASGSIGCQIAPGGFVTGLTATATGQTGGTAAGAVRLDACPPRFFRPSTFTNNSCSLCAPGRETRRTTGATVCLACIAGSTLRNPSDVNCTRCSEGTFREQPNTSGACDPCPPGRAVNITGASICPECAPGTFSATPGAVACTLCRAGTANPFFGRAQASACQQCSAGSFSAAGWDACDPCPSGTFQDLLGQTACKPCPAGTYCPTGAVHALPCPAGFFAAAQQNTCQACRAGTTSLAGSATCNITCLAGSACAASKAAAIAAVQWNCPAGGYMLRDTKTNKTTCVKCPANTFSSTAGVSKCKACPTGLWTNGLTGQTRCWARTLTVPPKRPAPAKAAAKALGG